MKQRTPLAAGAVALVVVLLWYMFMFKPKGAELSDTREKVEALTAEQQQLEGDLARLQVLDRDRPLRVAERQRLSGLIPERDELAGFLIAADEIATRSGLQWLSIAPQAPGAGAAGQPSMIALNMSLQGTFFQFIDYLGRLERLRRLVVVDSIALAPSGEGDLPASSGSPTLSVTLTARMFTLAPPLGTPTTLPAVTPTAAAPTATTVAPTATTLAGSTTPTAAATTAPATTPTAGGG